MAQHREFVLPIGGIDQKKQEGRENYSFCALIRKNPVLLFLDASTRELSSLEREGIEENVRTDESTSKFEMRSNHRCYPGSSTGTSIKAVKIINRAN